MNTYADVIDAIKALGSGVRYGAYIFPNLERAQSAAYAIADNDSEFVALARTKRAYISTVNAEGGAMLIIGGLVSQSHFDGLHRMIMAKDPIREVDLGGRIHDRSATPSKSPDAAKGGCFIATSVYGSSDTPEVMYLRSFRDRSLMPNLIGRLFVTSYYAISPPIARLLDRYSFTKYPVRYLINALIRVLKRGQ